MIDIDKLEICLKKVKKPARYIGGETNIVEKDFNSQSLRFAFLFPDVYEVGMSYLGLQILYYLINSHPNFLCERAFAPWPDMEKEMRDRKIPLYSLESKMEIKSFDIVGFTLQYEMSYTNILNMLDLAEISIFSKDRLEEEPLIIAGGPCASNPEPLASFIDLFIIGEGEEINIELFELYTRCKEKGLKKIEFLQKAAKLDGIYVPSFYKEHYHKDGTIDYRERLNPSAKNTIKKVRIHDVDKMFTNDRQIVPFIEIVHDRAFLELFRGCTHGCRFCQAGMLYRPIREKSPDNLMKITENLIKNTGYDELSLISLSSCDYLELDSLVKDLVAKYEEQRVSISLPSLRLDSFIVDILKEIEKVRKSGLTFAMEAGSQRLRNVINKNVTEEDLKRVVRSVFDEGWSRVKLYFMIGLPTETYQDITGIKNLAFKVKEIFFNRPKEKIQGNFQVTISASCFVPKAFTPFQWCSQDTIESFNKKIFYLKDELKDPKIKFQYHQPEVSRIEGIIARGDRRVSEVIYRAWKKGQVFDGWTEYFNYKNWLQALDESGVDGDFYVNRTRRYDEKFPWDFIDIGVSKKYLLKEYQKALDEETTDDCRLKCNACGISDCEMWEVFHEA